jgi:alpha-glucoside transport system substrate-binding protein
MSMKRKLVATGVCAAMMALTSGCLQDPNASGGGSGSGISGTVDGGTADDDQVVTILGAFGGDDEKGFNASLKKFEDESGIDVQYTGDTDFTTTVKQKVNSGDAPDIGLFPQPGGLLELAADQKIQPIDSFLDYDSLDETLIPGFLDASRMNGRVYGAPMRMALKSLVWYPTAAYNKGGYSKAPKSIQELTGIANKIKAGGIAPWCMGWESDQATGWVGTDWIEEYVLRMYGPDVYDQWVAHDIPFNDDRIVKAYDEFGKLAKTQGGLYVFPPFEGGYEGQPIMGGADVAALFNGNDKDAVEVMKFLTSDKFGAEWANAGGWLSPHASFDAANYPDETTRKMAKLAADADIFRYDASDVMPKEIGSGAFWTGMVDWLDGSRTSKQATTDIEDAWPTS